MRLAELLVTNGQVEEAAKYLKEAIALAEKANDANRLARAQQLMKKATGSNDN
jgi:hypothetical protein